ncbi:mannose-6-phosphate isomerase [Spirochaetia bacterium]|nr:mannose-6-phosphate isomerase [Spirochaetia bacterium]
MTHNKSENVFNSPLRVLPARVRRTYRGGSAIDDWHGDKQAEDSNMPEEWLVSATSAVNPGFPFIQNEGLSTVICGTDKHVLLRDLIEAAPESMLGAKHVERHGMQMGVLVKLIDSAERLSIQVHPDKVFAKRYFDSDFGKTECWHILKTRKVNGEEPYLLMGFRPGVTREHWQEMFQRQDIHAMADCLNSVIPKAGDTYLIPGGLPHAIGPGCFLVEIQEPTDLTLRSERTMQDGTPIPDKLVFQGLGEELLMDCFHYEVMNETALQLHHESVRFPGGSVYSPLASQEDTPCFSIERVACKEPLSFTAPEFSILAVLSGGGTINSDNNHSLPVKKGDQFFCPVATKGFTVNGKTEDELEFILCHPPGAIVCPPNLKQIT